MTRLDAAACKAVDSTGQFGEALRLADHLRDAMWRVDSANLAPVDAHGGLIVAGMGGSSVGGRLAAGAPGPRARPPLAPAVGYDIPSWIGPGGRRRAGARRRRCATRSRRPRRSPASWRANGARTARTTARRSGSRAR